MSKVCICIADADCDASAILELYRPYIENTAITFETEVPSLEAFSARIREISAAFPYLLLKIDGELAGYAYAHKQAERAAYGWNAELSIYLKQSWQGKGLGRPLYALLMDLLAMQGHVNFYGVITASNAGSIALHEKMGFHHAGVHEKTGYKFGQWHDVVWMHRRVHEGIPEPVRPFCALEEQQVQSRIDRTQAEITRRLTAE